MEEQKNENNIKIDSGLNYNKEFTNSVKIPPFINNDTETYPMLNDPTPIHLQDFNSTIDNEVYRFIETKDNMNPNRSNNLYFYKVPHNIKKRNASYCSSIKSQDFDECIPNKKMCPDTSAESTIDIASFKGANTVELLDHSYKDEVSEILSSNDQLSDTELNNDYVLPSPSLSSCSRIDNPDLLSNRNPSSFEALNMIPNMLNNFDALPKHLQSYLVHQMLKRMDRHSLQQVVTSLLPALKRDFLTTLPIEVTLRILKKLDAKSLAMASMVNKNWNLLIKFNNELWKRRLDMDFIGIPDSAGDKKEIEKWGLGSKSKVEDERRVSYCLSKFLGVEDTQSDSFTHEDEDEDENENENENDIEEVPTNSKTIQSKPKLNKDLYAERYIAERNWRDGRFKSTRVEYGHLQVITCLQFDDKKIILGSETSTVFVHSLKTGKVIKHLQGHEGGVWTLQFVGNILATGSTDRTVRIWDIERGVCTHVFTGHTSTVRCLQIVMPVYTVERDLYGKRVLTEPQNPLVITGSRDTTLRVWNLPSFEDTEANRQNDMQKFRLYQRFVLEGHTGSVRTISAHGKYLVSGSYDHTVKAWDLTKGKILWNFLGHTNRVYCVQLDYENKRCISGSLDHTIRVWDLITGECLHVLTDHTSLVGLLQISAKFLVSAAADTTVKVWDSESFRCLYTFKGHQGALMALNHTGYRVISGAEGSIKLWDIKTGKKLHNLVENVTGVWQIKASTTHCVAAVNRGNNSWLEILDFRSSDD